MKSTQNGRQGNPEGEEEESSRVLEAFHPTLITQAEDEQSGGMESSQIPTEITVDEDDPLSGLESYHATTSPVLSPTDEQSSKILSTSNLKSTPSDLKVIPKAEEEQSSRILESSHLTEITEVEDEQSARMESKSQANPFMKNLPEANEDDDVFWDHLNVLKTHLRDNLYIWTIFDILNKNCMTVVQQKVEEIFYLFDAIEFLIKRMTSKLKSLVHWKGYWLKADYLRIDIYHDLFMYALRHVAFSKENASAEKGNKNKVNLIHYGKSPLYYETTEFMVFLVNKVQEDEDIMTPTLVPQETNGAKKNFITNCIRMYEEETISVFICHVIKDERKEADDLFRGLVNVKKPSDILNFGRLYNYALQRAEDLFEVHEFLMSGRLSQRYHHVVRDIDQLNWLAMKHDNQVKVHNFLVDDLYLGDVEKIPEVMQRIDWAFVEKHDYPYLVKCVWAHRKMMRRNDAWQHSWTEVKFLVLYAFTSSAAIIVGGLDIMKHLLETWPELDVNASYKSVTALHIAAYKGNEVVVKYLLKKKELDIIVRTGRLIREENVKSGKKYNTNRWNMSTHQTALHIATTQGQAEIVKILCDLREPHRQRMRCHEEDEEERTPLDILYAKVNEVGGDFDNGRGSLSQIEKILLSNKDVQSGIDRLYRNRQVLVDAVNTILVGAALIAGVTFAGWLQPPLGYAQYYDLVVPYPAPAGTYDSYIAVQGNLGIKAFALFNSLSFFFAIATVIVAADAAFPTRRYKYIGHVIQVMQLLLQRAITFLIISLVCVLGAFGSAAIVILPPSLFFRKDLVLTIMIGGGVCCIAFWQLLSRHSERVQRLNAYITSIISRTNMF